MHKLSNKILHMWMPNRMKAKTYFNLSYNNFKFPYNFWLISQTNKKIIINNGNLTLYISLLYKHTFHVVQHPIYWYMPTILAIETFTPEF